MVGGNRYRRQRLLDRLARHVPRSCPARMSPQGCARTRCSRRGPRPESSLASVGDSEIWGKRREGLSGPMSASHGRKLFPSRTHSLVCLQGLSCGPKYPSTYLKSYVFRGRLASALSRAQSYGAVLTRLVSRVPQNGKRGPGRGTEKGQRAGN